MNKVKTQQGFGGFSKWLRKITKQQYIVIATAFLGCCMLQYLEFELLVNQGLTLFVCVSILWITQALHPTITALLVPILAISMGIFDTSQALEHFSHPIIFLFLGSFVIAAAMQSQNIDHLVANKILALSKGRFDLAVIYLCLMTTFLSLWISNTVTTAIMLPFALSLLTEVNSKRYSTTYMFVLLSICFSASIGGMGTILGSPANAIVAAQSKISFSEWLHFGLTGVMILMPLMLFSLYAFFKPNMTFKYKIPKSKSQINHSGRLTLVIFAITIACLIQSDELAEMLGSIQNFESVIVLSSVVVLAFLRLVNWKDIQVVTDWGVILLFGGGLTLSHALLETGASKLLASTMLDFVGRDSTGFVILMMIACIILFTQFMSNTTTVALLFPVILGLAQETSVSPTMVAALVAMAANCAFMLPVSTPPNAIVYGTGHIKYQSMLRMGLLLNVMATVVIYTISVSLWQ